MTRWAVVDTGPLVALLDRRERHHAWAVDALFGLIEKGALRIAFHREERLSVSSSRRKGSQKRTCAVVILTWR